MKVDQSVEANSFGLVASELIVWQKTHDEFIRVSQFNAFEQCCASSRFTRTSSKLKRPRYAFGGFPFSLVCYGSFYAGTTSDKLESPKLKEAPDSHRKHCTWSIWISTLAFTSLTLWHHYVSLCIMHALAMTRRRMFFTARANSQPIVAVATAEFSPAQVASGSSNLVVVSSRPITIDQTSWPVRVFTMSGSAVPLDLVYWGRRCRSRHQNKSKCPKTISFIVSYINLGMCFSCSISIPRHQFSSWQLPLELALALAAVVVI